MNQNEHGRLIYLTSGAGGMYCGSCMHDNALARSLAAAGWDVQLVPTYTPIRTDESDFSADQIFFGGINVFLQQKLPVFRHVPMLLDRFLDQPWLIRKVTSKAMEMDSRSLGKLAVSMLKGRAGNQRKEVKRLCRWLRAERPDAIMFTNILIGGCIPEIKRSVDVPVIVTLQGDDVFLDSLANPYRQQCIELIRKIAADVDGFIVHSEFFRDYMARYFALDRSRIHVTPLGIETGDFQEPVSSTLPADPPTVGYLARLAPEKGFHLLVDAFVEMKENDRNNDVKLLAAGWLGPQHKQYVDDCLSKIQSAGLSRDFKLLGTIDRAAKLKMLKQIDLLCVPTTYQEPKGLYVLEAMAAGKPVLVPNHGCFPELIEASAGGYLFPPNDRQALVRELTRLLPDRTRLATSGTHGRSYILEHRNAECMAAATSQVIQQLLDRAG